MSFLLCVCSTIFLGWRRTLTYDDIWAIRDVDSSSKIVPAFEHNWRREKTKVSTKETEKYVYVTYHVLSLDLTERLIFVSAFLYCGNFSLFVNVKAPWF